MPTYYKGKIILTKDIKSMDNEMKIGYAYNSRYELINASSYPVNDRLYLYDVFRNLEKIRDYMFKIEESTKLALILNEKYKEEYETFYLKRNYQSLNIIYEPVKGNDGIIYAKELYSGLIFPVFRIEDSNIKKYLRYESVNKDFFLQIKREFKFPLIEKLASGILNEEVCDRNELDLYLKKFEKGIFKNRNKQKFLETLKKLANSNVFKDEFKVQEKEKKQEVKREKQSTASSLIVNIEYLLSILKTSNQDLYNTYKNEYENLLKNPNLTYHVLAIFEGKLEFSLYFKQGEVTDILEYLTNLKKEYLSSLLIGKDSKTEFSFKKLNKINELFLKNKEKYNLLNQREVLRNLAFIYVLEVYENKDIFTLDELENSYFADNLKSIVTCIKSMQELNLIKFNYLISLESELTVETVFEMIRSIEFIKFKKEKVKELVKF